MTKVIVVGAGPAGSTAAYYLAKAGFDVSVFEEHPLVGRPIQCTGIVTKALFEFAEKDDSYIVNTLDGVRVTAPSGNVTEIPLKEWVICREKFDTFLMKKAESVGAKYFVRHKFVGMKDNVAVFKQGDADVKCEYDILIGADGPFSAVGRAAGLLDGRQYYIGSQATFRGSFDSKWFTTFFGSMAPGFFAWVVPESSTHARVGVATQRHVYKYFELLKQKIGGEIVERQAGPIPIFDGKQEVQKGNIFLAGDAAGLCKNTTGGGIITGMWSAKVLAESIIENRNYAGMLKPLRRELWIHEKLRNTLDKFSDADYERLVRWMNVPKVKKVLFDYPREYPSRFIWKLALSQPKLFFFMKYLFS